MSEHLKDLRRDSLRLPEYDYSQTGLYFVTLVTWQRECIFGNVLNEDVLLSKTGFLAKNEWERLTDRIPGIELDFFVFMPNHLHAIVGIGVGARRVESSVTANSLVASPRPPGYEQPPLGTVIGAYKSTVARLINGLRHTPGAPIWQRNYYEHVIRDEKDLARIREYIKNNPCNWTLDNENPGSLLP